MGEPSSHLRFNLCPGVSSSVRRQLEKVIWRGGGSPDHLEEGRDLGLGGEDGEKEGGPVAKVIGKNILQKGHSS